MAEINRAVLEAQKELYMKGREGAVASVSAFNGAIEAIDNLLALLAQAEEAAKKEEETEAAE